MGDAHRKAEFIGSTSDKHSRNLMVDTWICIFISESIKEVFTMVEFSERGTIHRPLEEQTYVFFKEFLEECEGI